MSKPCRRVVNKMNLTLIPTLMMLVLQFVLFPNPSWSELLWDNWYTVTQKMTPHSYYNEKVEIIKDTVKIQLNSWIQQGKIQVTENLGATAKNTSLLEPIRYNFRTTENNVEKSIDGNVSPDGKVFTVITTLNGKRGTPLRAEMLKKLILTSFFSVWINKNIKRINDFQPIAFQCIIEDQNIDQVPIINGSVYEMKKDEFAKSSKTRKLRIEFNRVVAYWWITDKGDAVKITLPSLEKEVNKVDKKLALSFIKEN